MKLRFGLLFSKPKFYVIVPGGYILVGRHIENLIFNEGARRTCTP